jgi:signal transduction histidine kinase
MQYYPILPEVRQDIFFIFKEAITNTVRHGKPWQVLVTLQQNYSFFQMEIQEQYAPGDALKAVPGLVAKSKKTGSGLQNMRFRADRIKAQLTIIPSHSGYSIRLTKKW